MINKLKPYLGLICLGLFLVFLLDYSRVTACKGVAVYQKCESYIEHYKK